MQSATIGKLAEALAKAQAEMKAPPKSKVMKIPGRGDYRYADLSDVIEARRVGAKYGLAITQGMEMREGYLALTTMLMHASGEWKAWECPLPAGLKPQELGSYLTYMRRYSESGAWGLAAEDDDDGERAQHAATGREERHDDGQADLPVDAVAINTLAADIQQVTGMEIAAIIKNGSYFEKDGAPQFFDDPAKAAKRPKWLASTRKRLEAEATKLKVMCEPGAAEAAKAFTEGLMTAPCCGGTHGPGVTCPKGATV